MSGMAGLDAWLLRGSGAYSTEHETTLDEPCSECGGTDGMVYVNDFGSASLECGNPDCMHVIEDVYEPEPDIPEPFDYDDYAE